MLEKARLKCERILSHKVGTYIIYSNHAEKMTKFNYM
jgi:hypothetical protein